MTATTTHVPRSVGLSRVSGNWGWFLDRIDAGDHFLLTYHHSRGRGAGRHLMSEPRCVAVTPEFHAAFADGRGVVERYASSKGRSRFSALTLRVKKSDCEHANHAASKCDQPPLFVVFARKMQESYTRTVTTSTTVTSATHPPSQGTETAVLVPIGWYCRVTGISRSQLAHAAVVPDAEIVDTHA